MWRKNFLPLFMLIGFGIWNYGYIMTCEHVSALRKAGVSGNTILAMMQQEGKINVSPEICMGRKDLRGNRRNAIVVYSTDSSHGSTGSEQDRQELERTWEMLKYFIIDQHGGNRE